MSKKLSRGKRKLELQNLERRQLLAADVMLDFFNGQADWLEPHDAISGDVFSMAMPIEFLGSEGSLVTQEWLDQDGESLLLDSGIWIDDAFTINVGEFGDAIGSYEFTFDDELLAGVEGEVFDADMSPEELAEALGVPGRGNRIYRCHRGWRAHVLWVLQCSSVR